MAIGFASVRRAALELEGTYDAKKHEEFFGRFDWHQFTPEEMALCPPILAIGGDGAMLDIGFQNLSRLLASGKPIRVVVLDTQVYSNTGGQACTSGFTGQVSDMAAWGKAQHGKTETRKELALLAMAHRNAFVLQSSQANPSHLLGGVLRALRSKYPAVISLNCPCPPEHGLGDDAATRAAKLALEARAFPVLVYDPAAGSAMAERLNLDGNPMLDDVWPTYELRYKDDAGAEQTLELPVTIADWAATESRFRKHFSVIKAAAGAGAAEGQADESQLRFDRYLAAKPEDREGKTPFIHAIQDGKLGKLAVSKEIVELAEDRLHLWHQLREMAGLEVQESVLDGIRGEISQKYDALKAEQDRTVAEFKAQYPAVVARRMAEGLIRSSANGKETIAELLSRVQEMRTLEPLPATAPAAAAAVPEAAVTPPAAPAASAAPAGVAVAEEEEGLGLDPYIQSELCTACNECTNLNKRMFAYNAKKQAYIKDPKAGTFKDLVMAAEKCPVAIIHPGTPLNPKEKDLEKWLKRAARFA
jgi:pyruvate-ferredoxin/flavodoxin oxidoreductase